MIDDHKYHLQIIEEFTVRLGIIGMLLALTMFTISIGVIFLILSANLSKLLESIDWGITFLVIVISIVIGVLVRSKLLPFVRDLFLIGEKLVRLQLREVFEETSSFGLLVGYYVFGGMSLGMYYGFHGWGHRALEFWGYTARVFVVESPIITLLLLILDWASALAALATCGFLFAIFPRVLSILMNYTIFTTWMLRPVYSGWLTLETIVKSLPSPPVESDVPDETNLQSINYDTLLNFTSRITIGAVLGGFGLLLGGHILPILNDGIPNKYFFIWVSVAILAGFLVLGFLYGLLRSLVPDYWKVRVRQLACVLRTVGGSLGELALMNTDRPRVNVLISLCWFVISGGVYLNGIRKLPVPRASDPPIQPFLSSSNLLSPISIIEMLVAPVFYFEFARILGVISLIAISIPLSYHGNQYLNQSQITELPRHLQSIIYKISIPLRVFTSKMTSSDTYSRWSPWIRGAILIQMLGVAVLLQSYHPQQSVRTALAVLGVGSVLQSVLVGFEVRHRYDPSHRVRWVWPVVIILLPFMGGVAYIIVEY